MGTRLDNLMYICIQCVHRLRTLNGIIVINFHPIVGSDHSQLKTSVPTSKALPIQSHDHTSTAAAGEHEEIVPTHAYHVDVTVPQVYQLNPPWVPHLVS